MNLFKLPLLLLLGIVLSCSTPKNQYLDSYCGYKMTTEEFYELADKSLDPLDSESIWSLLEQVEDLLRDAIPNTIKIEVLLKTLDKNHFSVIVVMPENQEHFKTIACTFMNAKLQGNIPEKRMLGIQIYSNSDSGIEPPLDIALKNSSK